MLHAVTYEIDGICGPGGSVDTSREQIVDFAISMAETALDLLGDRVGELEWFDSDGEAADPRTLLKSANIDEIVDVISQISDVLKSKDLGYVDLWEYEDLFELIEKQDVESWCSSGLKRRIRRVRNVYNRLIDDLRDEWGCS